MFGLVCSCTHVWAGMLMYPCLCLYSHVISIIVFCVISRNIFATNLLWFIQYANILTVPYNLMYSVYGPVCSHIKDGQCTLIQLHGLICSCTHVWADMLMYSCLGWYTHVLMFGLVCSYNHAWADMLMYSCLGWYAHVVMFELICSCTHVWADMFMYSGLGWYAHVPMFVLVGSCNQFNCILCMGQCAHI